MLNFDLIKKILWPDLPKYPNCRLCAYEELLPEGLTMGTLHIGRPGTGKTTSLARHLYESFKKYPKRSALVIDSSGPISKEFLRMLSMEPKGEFERLSRRVVYDQLGNPEWVIPMPEFSHIYGSSNEEQAQRLSSNLAKLAPALVQDAPFLAGLGLREIAPQLFRVITSINNNRGASWQTTEAKRLLTDTALLRRAIAKYGYRVPEAKWFLENVFLEWKPTERELRTYALMAMLGTIETPETRARIGSYRPGWTPREAIKNGLFVLVDGSRLINQRNTQHYLFTQVYSLFMSEINKREPGNPDDEPVALVMDEVYTLLSIPGMAEEVAMLAPLYRSRKLQLYIVLQSLSQLAPNLKEQIWSIGNVISFAISNFDEAYEIAQQIFKYDPQIVKLDARSETGQPIVEPDRGQYLQIANDLQRLAHRECIIRRYSSEKVLEKNVLWVKKTKDVPNVPAQMPVEELKEKLLMERAISVRDALENINQRDVGKSYKVSRRKI